MHISDNPAVLWSINPLHAVTFMTSHGLISFLTLGAVFLAVTGAEALYADLGHFGKRPIRYAWLFVVLPSLVINYLGQGAMVLARPETLANPFFLMVPEAAMLPMVILATAATIIASQAVITGAYSMTRQATQLGLLPRMPIIFTSASSSGQIYMPSVNWLLLAGVIVLVLAFKTSSNLAVAYGIAVTGTMVVTAVLAMFVIRNRWKWPLVATLALMLPLLAIDVIFLAANSLKISEGGWMPLVLGSAMLVVMWTWRRGSRQVLDSLRKSETRLSTVARSLAASKTHRIAGTAVFFSPDLSSAPTALLHSLKHFKGLHEHNIILAVRFADTPYVASSDRARVERISDDFTTLALEFGYLETPDVPAALKNADLGGISVDQMRTSYFLSRRSLQPSPHAGMPAWQDGLFILLARNADDASSYFQLPADRVVEMGTRITI
jgi:KUP system potassium uptake protein